MKLLKRIFCCFARLKRYVSFLYTCYFSPSTRRPYAVPHYTVQSGGNSIYLFDLKGQPTLFIIVGLTAALRVLCCKCRQTLFEIGVVGLHLNDAAMLVKIDHGCLLLLVSPVLIKPP